LRDPVSRSAVAGTGPGVIRAINLRRALKKLIKVSRCEPKQEPKINSNFHIFSGNGSSLSYDGPAGPGGRCRGCRQPIPTDAFRHVGHGTTVQMTGG